MSTSSSEWAEVADGVYRVRTAWTNCYLLVTPEGMTLIDAGLPGSWRPLVQLLASLGATPADLDAVVLTHGHFDHVGMAARLQSAHGVQARVHVADRFIARHPYRYEHQAARLPYLFRYPRQVPVLTRMALKGALGVRGVDAAPTVRPGEALDVPGRPVAIGTPGHTEGHCGFFLPAAGVLFSGDAIVTFDPYTGRSGPRIVADAATADSRTALDSLDAFLPVEADTLLPGHGEPWRGGVDAAVRRARQAGES